MKLLRAVQFIAIALMAFFLFAAVYTSSLIGERQQTIQQTARYNIAWLASQASVEVARLVQAINAFGVPRSGVDHEEVQLRLDIVQNRLKLMKGGEFDEFVSRDRERQEIVSELAAGIEAAQPLIDSLATQPQNVLRLMRLLTPLDRRLSKLAAAANVDGGARVDDDQQTLLRLHWTFSMLIVGLIACGLLLMAMMFWNFKVLRRTNGELQSIAAHLETTKVDLEAANQGIHTANAELNLHNQILKMRDAELRTQNMRFDAALNNMSHGLCMVGADGKLIVCNQQFRELFGIDLETARPGTAINAILVRIGVSLKLGDEGTVALIREQDALVATRNASSFTREYGDGRVFAIYHQPMVDGGWVATYEDITERKRTEDQISHMAHHDALTGLPNRAFFLKHLEESLAKARRGEAGCAVLCLDLDRFKAVNDTLGHPVGDLLLKAVSARLKAAVDKGDVVARFGGDEFAIIKNSLGDPTSLHVLGARLVKDISTPFQLEGNEVSVGTSVGIAIGFQDGASSEQLLKNADLALYHSKEEGRGAYHFFEARMDAKVQARRLVELDLKRAIPNNELELFYQPLVTIANRKIIGFEALIRWRHATRGMISPAEFIPIAEEVGLIMQIGEWVLKRACAEALKWPEDIKVAVNLSPVQFKDRNLVNSVKAALTGSGLSPNRLELEITETALVQDMDFTVEVLHKLRSLGVRISLDDFGTGYSSLSYLRSFPFDKIKIDQSFVRELGDRPDCLAIVRSVASLAQMLGMSTTAEGVETEEVLKMISDLGCSEVQGYYFSRPVPYAQVDGLLENFNGVPRVAVTAA
jgi:diguanylate cyclase (GGDEF)-like protein